MRLIDYLDKGASLGAEAPCLTTAGRKILKPEIKSRLRAGEGEPPG